MGDLNITINENSTITVLFEELVDREYNTYDMIDKLEKLEDSLSIPKHNYDVQFKVTKESNFLNSDANNWTIRRTRNEAFDYIFKELKRPSGEVVIDTKSNPSGTEYIFYSKDDVVLHLIPLGKHQ